MGELEKRLLVAIVLSALILVVSRFYLEKNAPKPPAPPTPTISQPVKPPVDATPVPPVQAPPIQTTLPVKQVDKIEVRVDSPLYSAVVSNNGALIRSWKLKKYKMSDTEDFEMMPQALDPGRPYPLALEAGTEALSQEINSAGYELKDDGAWGANKQRSVPATVTFIYQRPGLVVEKSFQFKENYIVDVKVNLNVDGKEQPCSLLLGPEFGSPIKQDDPRTVPHAVIRTDNKVQRITGDKLKTAQRFYSINSFAGIETQYFATVFLLQPENKEISARNYTWRGKGPGGKEVVYDLAVTMLPVTTAPVAAYVGPKEYETLQRINPNLTELIDYGYFAAIVKGFLWLLKLVYKYVHNYGVAIIILTLLLTIALFPLRYKQMVSMKKMQRMQPIVKAIQEKYKKMKSASVEQKQEMNKEIMEVYQKHGVNPLGGCLPFLPQLPIFYAFYSLLSSSIELRGAPFAWWIKDLSEKDPYYVMPVLMGITMLVQQKMSSGTGADPTQEKMMMLIMPIFLTFMFLNLASGLNLYFLFSNIFGIVLQKLSEHWIPQPPIGPTAPRTIAMPAGKK